MRSHDDAFLLDNAWELARARLAGMDLACDAETFHGLERIGVKPGWRCLDASSGSGSVARWLARKVGLGGRVTAVDRDTRHVLASLRPHEREVTDVLEGDIATVPLVPGSYDLVHARVLLVHLAQRDAVMRRLFAALKPGGIALLEEPDWGLNDVAPGVTHASTTLYRRVLAAIHRVLKSRGMQERFGLYLPQAARAAGFVVQETRCYSQIVQGDTEAARFEWLTFLQLRTLTLAETDVGEADFKAFLDLFHDPGFSYVRPLICCATARRP